MSIDATRWAWMQKVTPSQKLVLLSLADRAGEKGECYPSLNRLVKDTGLYRQTVIESIEALSTLGLVSVIRNMGQSNHYRLIGIQDRHGVGTSVENNTSMEKQPGWKSTPPQVWKSTLPSMEKHTTTSMDIHTQNLPPEPTTEPTTTTTGGEDGFCGGGVFCESKSEEPERHLFFPYCLKTEEERKAASALLIPCGDSAQSVLDVLQAAFLAGQVRKSPFALLSALVRRFEANTFDPSPGLSIAASRNGQKMQIDREALLEQQHQARLQRYQDELKQGTASSA